MPEPNLPADCRCREGLSRRELIQGTLMFAGVPPLCCHTPEVPPESVAWEGGTLVLDLARAAELRPVGAARAVVDAARKLNIIVAHPAKKRFVALDRSCTHGGAQCTYNQERKTVQCTSLNHAEYDLNGTLLHGRTHGNLRTYTVELAGTRLRIQAGDKR